MVWLASAGSGLSGAVLVGFLGRRFVADRSALVVLVFSLLWVLWVVVPVIAGAIDDSLDPRNFELLPLPAPRLAAGLLVAGLVGPGGLITVLVLVVGSVAGFAGPASFLPVALAGVVGTVLCVATSRAITALLSDVLRNRRTQEVVALVFGLLVGLAALTSTRMVGRALTLGDELRGMASMLAWTPFAAPGTAVASFAGGEWARGMLALGYALVMTLAATRVHGWALHRMLARPETGSGGRRRVSAGGLFPRWVPLPRTAVGAVAAREFKSLRRDARVRSQLVGGGIGLVVVGGTMVGSTTNSAYLPFAGAVVGFMMVAAVVPNQFGFDGGSMWAWMVNTPSLRSIMVGKNLGWAWVGAIPSTMAVVGGAVMGGADYLVAALGASVATLAVWLGVGNLTSVYGPIPMPEGTLFGNRNVTGANFIVSMLGLMAVGALLGPVGIGLFVVIAFTAPVWSVVGGVLAAGYGLAVYRVLLGVAGRLLEERMWSVLETMDGT
jgi:ABC-2 type transport system permease protein